MGRSIRQTRPQFVLILADESGSMTGGSAEAATEGIREMLYECRNQGPPGIERSYYRVALIRFGSEAVLDPVCSGKPVRHIDPEEVVFRADMGLTNIGAALEMAYDLVKAWVKEIKRHPEREVFPLPRVLLFSDGGENMGDPVKIACRIRELNVDGDPVVIAAAGISVSEESEQLLRNIASPGCYLVSVAESPTSLSAHLVSMIPEFPSGGEGRRTSGRSRTATAAAA